MMRRTLKGTGATRLRREYSRTMACSWREQHSLCQDWISQRECARRQAAAHVDEVAALGLALDALVGAGHDGWQDHPRDECRRRAEAWLVPAARAGTDR
eukprot:588932-Rhodomonas_salina.5